MPRRNDIGSILLIGSGPIVIGQACEFDYSGTQACRALREEGYRVSHMHIRHLNPLPPNVEEVMAGFRPVVCAELNLGQLQMPPRAKFLVDVHRREGEIAGKDQVDDGGGGAFYPQIGGERTRVADAESTA